jgi:NADH:ubiquinone oxidoreductase subunit D
MKLYEIYFEPGALHGRRNQTMRTAITYPQRAEYIKGTVSHETYYQSIADLAGIDWTACNEIGRIREALANGDEHLNTIPLKWWDVKAASPWTQNALKRSMKAHGDILSLAGAVCVLKQAAKKAAMP